MSPRNRFFVVLGIIVVIAGIYYWFSTNHSSDLVLVGTVDANQVIVSSKIAGRIEKLAVDEGTPVKEGDLIAEIDSAEWKAEAEAAQANITALTARIAEAESSEKLASGQTSSDVLNADATLQSVRAQLVEAEADLERTKSDTQRTVALAQQGVASQQAADQANAALKAAQAHVKALQDQVRAAEAAVKSAEARTHQTGAAQSNVAAIRGQLAQAKAQLAEAQTRLSYTKIVAPVSGTVSVRAAREGEVVNPGTPIVTIVDLSDTWIRAAIPETDADRIQLGDTLRVRMPSGRTITGKVIFKGVESSFATQRDVSRRKRDIQTVALKVAVENAGESLVPGMTAEMLVPTGKSNGGERVASEKK
jgi:multidrug resistance efflux pump